MLRFIIFYCIVFVSKTFNTHPIVGVIAFPCELQNFQDKYAIPSSYVKWIEDAGVQVIPIIYNSEREQLQKLLLQINGLIIPGGFYKIYTNKARKILSPELKGLVEILSLVKYMREKKFILPIFFIQNGFHAYMAIIDQKYGDDKNSLFDFKQIKNMSSKLKLMSKQQSRMFQMIDQETIYYVSNEDSVFYHSKFYISVSNFIQNKYLKDKYYISSISQIENGEIIVGSVQHKNLPIYGTQFMPNANAFEWNENYTIQHSRQSILFSQGLANQFIEQVRQLTKNNFRNEKIVQQQIIYNFPLIQGDHHQFHEQFYLII